MTVPKLLFLKFPKKYIYKTREGKIKEQDDAIPHASLSPMHLHSPSLLLCYNTLVGLEELLGTVETRVSMMNSALLSLHRLESCKHPQPPLESTNEDPKETNRHFWGTQLELELCSTARYGSNLLIQLKTETWIMV